MGGNAIGGGGFVNPSGGSYGSNSGGFSNSFGNNKPSKKIYITKTTIYILK